MDMKREVKSYVLIVLGAVIHALAFNMFLGPNQIPMGGLSGLAQIINFLIPVLPVGTMNMVMNVPLLLLSGKLLGRRMLISSVVAVATSSVAIDAIGAMHDFAAMDPFLSAIFGGAMMGLGLGLISAQNATLGGTSTLARLVKIKYPWLSTGSIIVGSDIVILVLAVLAFGKLEAALYGTIALLALELIMDKVLYGMDPSKVAYIVSEQAQEIAKVLMTEQERGVTVLRGEGAYTGDEKKILMVAFRQKDIVQIKRTVHAMDEKAFMVVVDASTVLGGGFDDYKKGEL
jgi:uncharacterized membrane-anchored protein YitT (DUF2179 family)